MSPCRMFFSMTLAPNSKSVVENDTRPAIHKQCTHGHRKCPSLHTPVTIMGYVGHAARSGKNHI